MGVDFHATLFLGYDLTKDRPELPDDFYDYNDDKYCTLIDDPYSDDFLYCGQILSDVGDDDYAKVFSIDTNQIEEDKEKVRQRCIEIMPKNAELFKELPKVYHLAYAT